MYYHTRVDQNEKCSRCGFVRLCKDDMGTAVCVDSAACTRGLNSREVGISPVYYLPGGRPVRIHADVARGREAVSYQLADGSNVMATLRRA